MTIKNPIKVTDSIVIGILILSLTYIHYSVRILENKTNKQEATVIEQARLMAQFDTHQRIRHYWEIFLNANPELNVPDKFLDTITTGN